MARNRKARQKGKESSNSKAPWMRQREVIEAAAKTAGLTVRVMNGGNHWQFTGGPFLVNWYPSTGTIYVDGTTYKMNGSWNQAIKATQTLPKAIQHPVARKNPGPSGRRKRAELKVSMLKIRNTCHWCGDRLRRRTASLEHIIPLSRGGLDGGSNLTLACYPCNWTRQNEVDSNRAEARRRPGDGLR